MSYRAMNEKLEQMDVWWQVLLVARHGLPTIKLESFKPAGTVGSSISVHAAAISDARPHHLTQQKDEWHPRVAFRRRPYYNEPIFRPRPEDLKTEEILKTEVNLKDEANQIDSNNEAQSSENGTIEPNEISLSANITSSKAHEVHLHIITYGSHIPWVFDLNMPVLFKADLRDLHPPPLALSSIYTGINKEVADTFWSHPEHEKAYHIALSKIGRLVKGLELADGKEFAVLINSRRGAHRSVAFAVRLHRELGG